MKTVLIIAAVVALMLIGFHLYKRYFGLIQLAEEHPQALKAVQSADRYVTDAIALKNAISASTKQSGDFSTRLGTFFSALPV